jgi:hypothetical protein
LTSLTVPVPFAGVAPDDLISDCENPRWDPRFTDHWLMDLVTHWGKWRRPRKLAPNALSGELCTAARDARVCAERIGFVVEAGPAGYRVVDFHHPERVYMVKPGAPVRESEEPDASQLQLCCGGVE